MKLFEHRGGAIYCTEDFNMTIIESAIFERDLNTLVMCCFGDIECNGKKASLTYGSNPITSHPSEIIEGDNSFIKLVYKKGDIFSESDQVLVDSSYSEIYCGMLSGGKLKFGFPVEHQLNLMINSVINNEPLAVPRITYELNSSVIARSKANPSKPYRLDKSEGYTMGISFRGIAAATGTFQAVTFEDPSAMCMISVTRKKNEDSKSSIEEYSKL